MTLYTILCTPNVLIEYNYSCIGLCISFLVIVQWLERRVTCLLQGQLIGQSQDQTQNVLF